jgi:hypothetical protein
LTDVTEWDALLETAIRRGYLWQVFRTDRHGPEFLAGVRHHSAGADVIVLSGADIAHAYRLPDDADVFTPDRVYWWYAASPVWTLRALLTLPAPGDHDAPRTLHPAPPGAGIPVTARRTT